MSDDPRTLVSTNWLAQHINDPDLRIIDASWYLPDMGRDAKAEYDDAHIPGARFVPLEEVSDARSEVPHMAPPIEKFMSRMRAWGIGDGHQVVVYDGIGLFSAARIWWLFKLMGKQDVAVLDGGFPKWQAEGRPIEDLPPVIRDRHMTVSRQAHLIKDVTQVAQAAKLGTWQIVDARGAARFRGEEPEPRPGLRAGHIPNSINVPYKAVLHDDSTMMNTEELRRVFSEAGIDLGQPVITTCGSGVTAAILSLALARLGHDQNALYDGSWAEWGMYPDLKIETGA